MNGHNGLMLYERWKRKKEKVTLKEAMHYLKEISTRLNELEAKVENYKSAAQNFFEYQKEDRFSDYND